MISRRRWRILCFVAVILLVALSCGKKERTEETVKKDGGKTVEKKSLGEDELQKTAELPPVYPATYEELVSSPGGIIHDYGQVNDGYYSSDTSKTREIWERLVIPELVKLEPLPEDASEEEIEKLFREFLRIVAVRYEPIESIDKFGYVIFKNDMTDPFSGRKIEENVQVNVEIVLDVSGSMSKKIGDRTMMEIAKDSLLKMMETMPKTANVGLRVYGHKGDNTAKGKDVSCSANELIQPLEKADKGKMEAALQNIRPTGWTPLASAMEKGMDDLRQVRGEKSLNILYVITDGIETCGGNPEAVAEKLRKENEGTGMDIIVGIIGFNVDAGQSRILKKIADAAGGKYSLADNASNLLYELQQIHEMAYSQYKWEYFNQILLNRLTVSHNGSLVHNKYLADIAGYEINLLGHVEQLAYDDNGGVYTKDIKTKKLFEPFGEVRKKLRILRERRKEHIEALYKAEYEKRKKESEEYIKSVTARKGEMVHYVRMTSRVNPDSAFYRKRNERWKN